MRILQQIILIISIGCILSLYYLYKKQQNIIEKYEFSSFSLDKNIKKKIILNKSKAVIFQKKENKSLLNNDDKKEIIEKQEFFIPPEGKVTIIETKGGEIKIDIKDKGSTFKMGLGVLYDGEIYPALGVKLLYFKRYNLILVGYKEGLGVGVSRYIDDFAENIFLNTQIMGGFNLINKKFFIGLKINF